MSDRTRTITLANARAKYVNRFTMEHTPQWARELRTDGMYYAPHYRSDTEWYANTSFPGENGVSIQAKHCESNGQTWPLGQSLAEPYLAEHHQYAF